MKRIVEFPLLDGGSVLVEVDAPANNRIGLTDEVAQKAQKHFEEALDNIKPVASAIVKKLQSLSEPAEEVEVKFGIKMTAGLGAVIASGSAEVNYEITLKWKRESKDGSTP